MVEPLPSMCEGLDYIYNATKFKHIKAGTKDFEGQTLQATFMFT